MVNDNGYKGLGNNFTSDTFFMVDESVSQSTFSDETKTSEENESVWSGGYKLSNDEMPKVPTNVNGYEITEIISDQGSEAIVYYAQKSGVEYAVKIYRYNAPDFDFKLDLLKSIDNPYIVKLIEYGKFGDLPFEVFPYYRNGTLKKMGKVEDSKLKNYIYQINEGLNSLHTGIPGESIIHGDLKPSNIFVSDNFDSVLIGDFGISRVIKNGTFSIDKISGTPEFAPPTRGLVGQEVKTTAYDYGSFGLLVFYMVTGYSYFANWPSDKVIEKWQTGIDIPQNIDGRLRGLMNHLLQIDEQQRYGYEDIKNWYEGAYVKYEKPKNIFKSAEQSKSKSLWLGIFENESIEVDSVPALVDKLKKHWNLARYRIKDTNLYDFIDFYGFPGDVIAGYVKESDVDSAIFKTIYTLSDKSELVYKGKFYSNEEAFFSEVDENDETANEMISKNLLTFYLKQMGKPLKEIEEVRLLEDNKSLPIKFKVWALKYILTANKSFNSWNTLDDFINNLNSIGIQEIYQLVQDEKFLAWLYSKGLTNEVLQIISNKGD